MIFDKRWSYRAGQYAFVMIPQLGVHCWHPFTLSSAPHELKVTLHVRSLGGWTQQLAALAAAGPVELPAFVEGPYGLPSVNLEDDTYKIVLLISGGIGVTPNQSIANDLIEAQAQGRLLKKIIYVWALRAGSNAELVDTMVQSEQFPRPRAPTKQLKVLQAGDSDADGSPVKGGDSLLHAMVHLTVGAAAAASGTSAVAAGDVEMAISAERTLAASTSPTVLPSLAAAGIPHTLHSARPDFPVLFARVRELAQALGERRVAVSICGPSAMVEDATAACRHISCSSGSCSEGVQFDLHIEVFQL